jgi:hypothetical protein
MSSFIHLLGADDVRGAGYAIGAAANEMYRAASLIDSSVYTMIQALNEFTGVLHEYMERLDKQSE